MLSEIAQGQTREIPRQRKREYQVVPERASLVTGRVEFDSSEVSDCAHVAVVEAPTKWRVC